MAGNISAVIEESCLFKLDEEMDDIDPNGNEDGLKNAENTNKDMSVINGQYNNCFSATFRGYQKGSVS